MKKSLLFLLTVVSMALLASCGGNSSSEASDASSEEKGIKYESQEYGYSIELPAGFKELDNPENERALGVKKFVKAGCVLQIEVKDVEVEAGKNVAQMVKEKYEKIKKEVSEDDPEEDVRMLDSLSFAHIWKGDPDLYANIEIYKNGKLFVISIEGVGETIDSYNKFVDILYKSLKMQ